MRAQKTMHMAEIALMSALLCVISPITIPIPFSPVPLSLATFGVYLSAVLLGAKGGAVSVLIYLMLGAAGLPVFSGFSGGLGVLLGPTGGYLAGYVPCALIAGGLGQAKRCKFSLYMLAMGTGTLACYLLGTVWFLVIMKGAYTVLQALAVCVAPYLLFDVIKILLATVIAISVQKRIGRIKQ